MGNYSMGQGGYGPKPYTADLNQLAMQNQNYRTALWTGRYLQVTLMSIPPCGDIGAEIHPDTDQMIRVEAGRAVVQMGKCKDRMDVRHRLSEGDVVFVPAGTWHNVVNSGRGDLKVSSVYAPPHHKRGTIQRTKKEAEYEE